MACDTLTASGIHANAAFPAIPFPKGLYDAEQSGSSAAGGMGGAGSSPKTSIAPKVAKVSHATPWGSLTHTLSPRT